VYVAVKNKKQFKNFFPDTFVVHNVLSQDGTKVLINILQASPGLPDFQTKKSLNWVNLGVSCNERGWKFFWQFGLFYSQFVYYLLPILLYFVVILVYFPVFVCCAAKNLATLSAPKVNFC
jgi:hypothetical protein